MTTITLDLPDQLAAELEPIHSDLPLLLAISQQLFRPVNDTNGHTSAIYLAYKQLFDFFAAAPSPQQIKHFVISPQAQARVHELLEKHGEGELNAAEQAELRVYSQIHEVIGLKKAEAALALVTFN